MNATSKRACLNDATATEPGLCVTLSTLPVDMLGVVYSYLAYNDRRAFRETCKHMAASTRASDSNGPGATWLRSYPRPLAWREGPRLHDYNWALFEAFTLQHAVYDTLTMDSYLRYKTGRFAIDPALAYFAFDYKKFDATHPLASLYFVELFIGLLSISDLSELAHVSLVDPLLQAGLLIHDAYECSGDDDDDDDHVSSTRITNTAPDGADIIYAAARTFLTQAMLLLAGPKKMYNSEVNSLIIWKHRLDILGDALAGPLSELSCTVYSDVLRNQERTTALAEYWLICRCVVVAVLVWRAFIILTGNRDCYSYLFQFVSTFESPFRLPLVDVDQHAWVDVMYYGTPRLLDAIVMHLDDHEAHARSIACELCQPPDYTHRGILLRANAGHVGPTFEETNDDTERWAKTHESYHFLAHTLNLARKLTCLQTDVETKRQKLSDLFSRTHPLVVPIYEQARAYCVSTEENLRCASVECPSRLDRMSLYTLRLRVLGRFAAPAQEARYPPECILARFLPGNDAASSSLTYLNDNLSRRNLVLLLSPLKILSTWWGVNVLAISAKVDAVSSRPPPPHTYDRLLAEAVLRSPKWNFACGSDGSADWDCVFPSQLLRDKLPVSISQQVSTEWFIKVAAKRTSYVVWFTYGVLQEDALVRVCEPPYYLADWQRCDCDAVVQTLYPMTCLSLHSKLWCKLEVPLPGSPPTRQDAVAEQQNSGFAEALVRDEIRLRNLIRDVYDLT